MRTASLDRRDEDAWTAILPVSGTRGMHELVAVTVDV